MKIITATHDGKINSSGFKSWYEARTFVMTRIPEDAFVRMDTEHWTKLDYIEMMKDSKYKIHTWELNEISVTGSRSS